jgi:Ca2+-dependent lipid-binding protein
LNKEWCHCHIGRTKEPKWNEDFVFNIKLPPAKKIEIAAWDANLVTPHKRMGNSEINLESVCDGNLHKVLVELDGIGGGGKVQLEVSLCCQSFFLYYCSVDGENQLNFQKYNIPLHPKKHKISCSLDPP